MEEIIVLKRSLSITLNISGQGAYELICDISSASAYEAWNAVMKQSRILQDKYTKSLSNAEDNSSKGALFFSYLTDLAEINAGMIRQCVKNLEDLPFNLEDLPAETLGRISSAIGKAISDQLIEKLKRGKYDPDV